MMSISKLPILVCPMKYGRYRIVEVCFQNVKEPFYQIEFRRVWYKSLIQLLETGSMWEVVASNFRTYSEAYEHLYEITK